MKDVAVPGVDSVSFLDVAVFPNNIGLAFRYSSHFVFGNKEYLTFCGSSMLPNVRLYLDEMYLSWNSPSINIYFEVECSFY